MSNTETFDFERAVRRRALELVAGQPPTFNIAPTIDLVRRAFAAGYDLVPMAGQVEK